MTVEYCDFIGFGLAGEAGEPEHRHAFLTRPWRVPEYPGMDIYDCACGVRRIVPAGMSAHDGEDMPILSFPDSCPRQAIGT